MKKINLDKIGGIASTACAIHCLIMPIVIILIPLIGLSFLASTTFEYVLLILTVILGTLSVCGGYKEHKSKRPIVFLTCGLTILLMHRLMGGPDDHNHGLAWAPFFGGISVALSHFFNYQLCKTCKSCKSHI